MPPVSDQRDGSGRYQTTSGPEEPLPLRQLILLNRDDDIRAWFLANNGHDPLDLMVLESRPEDGEDPDETPEPEGATRAPSGAAAIIVDDGDVSIETEPAHRSRQDS